MKRMTRRELLYMTLGGSAALLGIGSCGATAWSLLPRAHYGVDLFSIEPNILPQPDSIPLEVPNGNFFLSNTSAGLYALCRNCPHLGATMKWVDTNKRFECPAHGRKHTFKGKYIEGPGPISTMYQFNVEVKTPDGTHRTDDKPAPVNVQDATSIVVDVRKKMAGDNKAE